MQDQSLKFHNFCQKFQGREGGQHGQHFVKIKFVKNRVGGRGVTTNLDNVCKYTGGVFDVTPKTCLRHISGISQAGISHTYLRPISGLSQAYLRYISSTSWCISGKSKAYLIHISDKTQSCIRHLSSIPHVYQRHIKYIKPISGISKSSLTTIYHSLYSYQTFSHFYRH